MDALLFLTGMTNLGQIKITNDVFTIINYSALRMQIEENSRDAKNARYGLFLEYVGSRNVDTSASDPLNGESTEGCTGSRAI